MAMYMEFLPVRLPQRHPHTHFLGYLCTHTRLALKALGIASYGHGGGITQNVAFRSPYSMWSLYKHITHFIIYLFTLWSLGHKTPEINRICSHSSQCYGLQTAISAYVANSMVPSALMALCKYFY